MRWTQRYGIVAIAIVVVLALVFVLQQKQLSEEQTRQTIESLQNRIDYVSRLNDEHRQELSSIKQQNIRLIRSLNSVKSCQRRLNTANHTFSPLNSNHTTLDETINDNSVYSLTNGFHLPSSFSYLKHLQNKHDMLSPSFRRQTTNLNFLRTNISFVIGVPTVKRDKQSYLIETIKSLLDNLNNDDIERLLIVVFIAEPFDIEYVRTTAHELEKLYDKYIENGLIEIISPPIEFYPDFDQLKLSLNDDKQRVKWRTKQNYDFTYLMMYSSIRGKYYIQLEDDVVTKPGYIHIIENFINRQQDQNWFMLEYSSLGFIGKMFHTSELDALVNFFLMFSADKPIDWLLEYYQDTRFCSFGADTQSCARTKGLHRFRFRPSLFQHIGIYSSLKGKIQKLKDKDFGKNVKLFKSHENPPVSSIISTLKDYEKHTVASCYAGQNFFWALQPKKDDTIEFKYDPPLLLSRIYFKSGNPEHPGDKFFNTTIDLQPYVQPKEKLKYLKDSDGFYTVANFSHDTGIAEAFVDKALGPISNVRLKVHSKSDAWIILNEIDNRKIFRMDILLNNQITNYNDDPNRLWIEIDRGIRSKEPQRQFEAILKMPGLFKKETTSTTLISAALIKLATLFQEGTNEMRLNVTKVLDRVANQLQKSSMLDDPIKLIYSVMHSNDCIARALTLRALAILAHILADDVEAHLHIRLALDSNDEIEILAAVKAAKKFIPCSKTFAMSISTKLVSLVEDLTTPLTIKSWLIPLFEHMTHDATVSMKGRQLLISLMTNDTTEEFLQIAVPTLARLAVKSHIEIAETVTFFLQFLKLEPRQNCRKLILHHLVPIARCGSIVWLDSTTEDLIQFANNNDDDFIRLQVLRIIEVLVNGGAYISPASISDLKNLLQMFTIHNHIPVAYQCCSTALRIVLKYRNISSSSDDLIEHLNTALAILLAEVIQSNNMKELQDTLNLIEQLSRVYTHSAQNFIHLLFTTCANVENPELLSYLTKSLVRLSTNHTEIIANETIQLRRLLANTSLNDDVRYNLLALFVLSNSNNIDEIHAHIQQLSSWKCFLLARWCIRHCLYKLAIDLLQLLRNSIQISIHIIWIETIIAICRGEERLQTTIDSSKNNLEILCENLAEAGSFYESSLIQMPTRLAIDDDDERSIDATFDFERAYCDIRSSIIHQFYELIHTIYQYDLGMISFDLLGKRVLTIIAKRFSTISMKINDIQQSCFDGDSQTLWCFTFNRFLCDLIAAVIERIIRHIPLDKTTWQDRLNEMSWRDGFTESMFNRFQSIVDFVCTQLHSKKTTKKNIDEELAILQYLARSLVTTSSPIPRMFFQKLQQTVVKLVVSPNENEDRPVHESDALLPVQIHGEIDATYHRLPLRTVKQVFVEVLTNEEMNRKTKTKVPMLDQITDDNSYRGAKASLFSAGSSLSKTVDNENDHYENVILNEELKDNRFHAGFILHLGSVASYNIHVRVSFEDNNGQRWTNVAEKTICIKLSNRRQTRSTTATRPSLHQLRSTGATN